MCRDCNEISWEISEDEPVVFDSKSCKVLSFLENDCLDVWKTVVETHTTDQLATFLTSLAEKMAFPESSCIHPLIGQFFLTYEKILTDPKKKFVFFEHFCSLCFLKKL
jgi:hypothetical protein